MTTRVATGLLLLLIALSAAVVLVGERWSEPVLRDRFVTVLARATGLDVEVSGPVELVWLPRPGLRAMDVALRSRDGTLALNAEEVTASLDCFRLLRGESRIVQTTLRNPTAVVDLDRAASAPNGPMGGILTALRGQTLRVRDGVVRLRSSRAGRDALLSDVAATWSWPKRAGASLSGEATLRGQHGSFAIALNTPDAWLAGTASPGFVHVKSPALEVGLDGTLGGDGDILATGRLTASTRNLPRLLELSGLPLTALDRIDSAQLKGNVTLTAGTLALADVTLGLDDMLFEGALAFGAGAAGPSVAGTLASDRIDLDPFLATLPPVLGTDRRWSRELLDARKLAFSDIDLRVSATHAHYGRFELEDGALSLQSGGGRMEISLGEARAYEGLLKGRLVAAVEGTETAMRVEGSFSQVDLKALAGDLGGAGGMAGTTNGHLSLEAKGRSPQALADTLSGQGQVGVRDGWIGPDVLASITRPEASGSRNTVGSAGQVAFDAVSLGFDLSGGTLRLRQSSMTRADLLAALEGTASIARQEVDLKALIETPGDEGTPGAESASTLTLAGAWPNLYLAFRTAPLSAPAPWRVR